MPDRWDIERYRRRAEEWRERAASQPEGKETIECLVIAEGYERLIEVIQTQRRGPHRGSDMVAGTRASAMNSLAWRSFHSFASKSARKSG